MIAFITFVTTRSPDILLSFYQYPELVTQMHKNQKARDTNLLVQDPILHTLMRERESSEHSELL